MRILFTTCLLALSLCWLHATTESEPIDFLLQANALPGISAPSVDSPQPFSYNTDEVDLVQPDPVLFKKFKKDSDYDYYSTEKEIESRRSWMEWLLSKLFDWLSERSPERVVSERETDATFLIIGIILLIVLTTLLFIYRPTLFFSNKKRSLDYRVEEDNIYGWDFDKLIAQALQNKEYNHAIRWKYLQMLKLLDDKEFIAWNPNKTVNEYCYELKSPTLRSLFKDLSLIFLHFRYGNFDAHEEHYDETSSLFDKIKNTLEG